MRFRDLPIERKLFVLILPICLIPAAIFMVLTVWGARMSFERSMGDKLSLTVADYAHRFDSFSRLRMRALSRLEPEDLRRIAAGELPVDNRSQRVGPRRAAPTGSGLFGPGGLMARLEWLDAALIYHDPAEPPEALLLAPDLSQPAPVLPAPFVRYWYDMRASLPTTGTLVDVVLDYPEPVGEQPAALMILPVQLDEEREGLIFYAVRTERLLGLWREYANLNSDMLLVRSERGRVLFASPASHPLLAKMEISARRNAEWFPLGNQIVAHAACPDMLTRRDQSGVGSVWTFMLQYDMGHFTSQQDSLIWLAVLVGLGLVLAMLGLASLAASWLTAPLRALQDQAHRVAQGDLSVHAPVSSRDEIGALGDAFNIMARRLRATYQTLEERVEENRLRAEHIHLINEMAGAIIRALSLDDIFTILRRELERILPFDAIWLARLEEGRGLRVTHISPGGLISLRERVTIPLEGSLHGRVAAERETLRAEIGPDNRIEFFETRLFNSEGFQSFLIAPLPARKGIIGTLAVASLAPDAYNQELAEVVASLARTVAISIEQADLFRQVSEFAAELERKVDQRTHELDLANQKLIQAEKYFATGRMAGNLAHEVNNPLAIIKNYIQIVRANLMGASGGRRRTDPNLECLEVINEEVDRIARLVHQLLDLHRPVEQRIEPVDINLLIQETLAIVEEDFRRTGIEVVHELQPQLPRPVVSADLIRQVLINLIRNARDAMEQGGRLTIRTSSITEWLGGQERDSVRVRVSDTGCGIPPEQLSQVFDPFFSTKPSDKGTGLGLCVSYSIVQMYQGTIDLESEPGRGTTVIFSLPVEDRGRVLETGPQAALGGTQP